MSAASAFDLFRPFDRELWLLTSAADGRRGGLIATAVLQASITPAAPRVIAGVSRRHATWELMAARGAFTLQLLPADRLDLVEQLGLRSGRDLEKCTGTEWADDLHGGPRLVASPGWLDCRVEAEWDAGDRTFFLAEVTAAQAPEPGTEVLTMQRLLATAPPEWLTRLREQVRADAEHDLSAIVEWRATRTAPQA